MAQSVIEANKQAIRTRALKRFGAAVISAKQEEVCHRCTSWDGRCRWGIFPIQSDGSVCWYFVRDKGK